MKTQSAQSGLRFLLLNWRDPRNPEAGGAEVHLHEVARRMVADGSFCIQVSHAFPGSSAEEIIDGVHIIRCGGKFLFNDAKETPEVLASTYHYPKEKKIIEFEVRPWITNLENGAGVGNIFYGSKGYLVVYNYERYESFLGARREPGPKGNAGGDHWLNFMEAVQTRDKAHLNAPVETAHLASALAHLGNIAYRTGRTINFDPVKEEIIGDSEASAMLTRPPRKPYVVPDKV